MSDSHSSGGGTGKKVVIGFLGLLVAVYAVNILKGPKRPADPSAPVVHEVKIDPKEFEKLKSENEVLRQEMESWKAKAISNETTLNNVRNLLRSEAAVSQ